jgi:hypothetical protein
MMQININNLKLAKIYTGSTIDFVTIDDVCIRSLITDLKYDRSNNSITGIDVIPVTNEYKYFLKQKLTNIPHATETEFFLARSLGLSIEIIQSRQLQLIVKSYCNLLTRTLRGLLTHEEIKVTEQIADGALLFQYLPRDKFVYNAIFHTELQTPGKAALREIKKRFSRLHETRIRLYEYIYPSAPPFVEMYDKQLNWAQSCLRLFSYIDNFTYVQFFEKNEVIMKQIRPKWLNLIVESYEKAKTLLTAEEEEAKKFDDNDSIVEIQIIKKSLQEAVEKAEVDIKFLETPKDVLQYWPHLLSPGPIFLCIE